MREIFTRKEDGQEVMIESDMSAYGYSQKYSWLLSIFIKFDASKNTQEGFEEFLETKEALIIALELDDKAKYVGSRVVDGWSELYFYAKDSKNLDAAVASILKGSGYIFESNVVRDSKWDFHHKHLAPNELELCHIQSDKIIYMLEDEGDDLTLEREVEHYLSFDTPTQKERFLQNFTLADFSYKDEISSDEFENGVALVAQHAVTKDIVQKSVEALFHEVKKEHGYYEGWSTVLANENSDETLES